MVHVEKNMLRATNSFFVENSARLKMLKEETELVTMVVFGYITINVPSVFSAVTEKDGMYVSCKIGRRANAVYYQ